MGNKKVPAGYYDPKDHVLVHRDYIDGLIDALNTIHASSGDPVIERICERALKSKLAVPARLTEVEEGKPCGSAEKGSFS